MLAALTAKTPRAAATFRPAGPLRSARAWVFRIGRRLDLDHIWIGAPARREGQSEIVLRDTDRTEATMSSANVIAEPGRELSRQ